MRPAWLDRQYAYEAATTLPSRVTVTGLAGHEITMAEAPAFVEPDRRLCAAERGTAVHTLLRAIALRPHTAQSVTAEIARLQNEGILSAAEAEAISPARIAAFFASPLGKRLSAATMVRRELEFNYRVSARHLLGVDTDEPILLQGVIDCCFLEGGTWVLLDYKTDFVAPGTPPEEAAAKHARQVSLYAEALAALTGTPVGEAYVCSVSYTHLDVYKRQRIQQPREPRVAGPRNPLFYGCEAPARGLCRSAAHCARPLRSFPRFPPGGCAGGGKNRPNRRSVGGC